jgi:hypothetical protein
VIAHDTIRMIVLVAGIIGAMFLFLLLPTLP